MRHNSLVFKPFVAYYGRDRQMEMVQEGSMKVIRVPCRLECSLFSSQYRTSFVLEGKPITTICDASFVCDGTIELTVMKECDDGSVIVAVPGELITGWRMMRTSGMVTQRFDGESNERELSSQKIDWDLSLVAIAAQRVTPRLPNIVTLTRRLFVRFFRHWERQEGRV